ncbi:unnamed protein product [Mesocestoides corti]|uniref:Neur_chan_LBD domain-containing protein n=1 Tax=Mesocestoides corti TaxID=53468 RepID=A0A0R3UDX5_MESCO|nr:unnamed protein product [Mesocestoides corti]
MDKSVSLLVMHILDFWFHLVPLLKVTVTDKAWMQEPPDDSAKLQSSWLLTPDIVTTTPTTLCMHNAAVYQDQSDATLSFKQ